MTDREKFEDLLSCVIVNGSFDSRLALRDFVSALIDDRERLGRLLKKIRENGLAQMTFGKDSHDPRATSEAAVPDAP